MSKHTVIHQFPTFGLALVQYGPVQFGTLYAGNPATPALSLFAALHWYGSVALSATRNLDEYASVTAELTKVVDAVKAIPTAEQAPATPPVLPSFARGQKIQIGYGLMGEVVIRSVAGIRTEQARRVGTAMVYGQTVAVTFDPVRDLWLCAPLSQTPIRSAMRASKAL